MGNTDYAGCIIGGLILLVLFGGIAIWGGFWADMLSPPGAPEPCNSSRPPLEFQNCQALYRSEMRAWERETGGANEFLVLILSVVSSLITTAIAGFGLAVIGTQKRKR